MHARLVQILRAHGTNCNFLLESAQTCSSRDESLFLAWSDRILMLCSCRFFSGSWDKSNHPDKNLGYGQDTYLDARHAPLIGCLVDDLLSSVEGCRNLQHTEKQNAEVLDATEMVKHDCWGLPNCMLLEDQAGVPSQHSATAPAYMYTGAAGG